MKRKQENTMKMKPKNSENRRLIYKPIAILISAILIICIGFGVYFGYRLVRYENFQKNAIVDLQNQVATQQKNLQEQSNQLLVLNNRIASINAGPFQWSETGFNYLTIGNSITRHGIIEGWWNAVGMAASDADHDYFHLVMDYLETKQDHVVGGICGLAVWESLSSNRSYALPLLDPYLSGDLDLVTVQLGENVSDLTTFEKDFEDLLRYIISRAPNADIIVVGDFWESGGRDSYKKQAAENCGVVYVPLEGIKNNPEYYCGVGTVVYDANGGAHTVDREDVAAHPGDNGMQAIADLIIAAYSDMNNE